MNRIILIGNGFDIAHGLPTKYTDFMNDYWERFHQMVFNSYSQWIKDGYGVMRAPNLYKDNFASFEIKKGKVEVTGEFFNDVGNSSFSKFSKFSKFIKEYNDNSPNTTAYIKFNNNFFGLFSKQSSLTNWVDIENEYYNLLKSYLKEENKNELVKKLNKEFDQVKNMLENYLTEISKDNISIENSIQNALESLVEIDEVAFSKKELFFNSIWQEITEFESMGEIEEELKNHPEYSILRSHKEIPYAFMEDKLCNNKHYKNSYTRPNQTLLLNFNYTNVAEKHYSKEESGLEYEIINIHGELNSKTNPIIFGYGDELDDDYKNIEKTNNGDFLENVKSIHYHNSSNYRLLLKFIQSSPFQVFVMGHSCGNSDRTLLNTIFEHPNCFSIKPYYWDKGNGKNDYTDLIKNISRNFNNKQNMRDIVVNKEYCKPLIPAKSEQNKS